MVQLLYTVKLSLEIIVLCTVITVLGIMERMMNALLLDLMLILESVQRY